MNKLGFLFDMDGVIVANHEYHYLAWQQIAAKYGADIDEEFYRLNMNGRTLTELVEVVFEGRVAGDKVHEIGSEKEKAYRDLYAPHLAPTNGLIDFLESALAANIPMVVGTSAPVENVIFTLDGLNIRHYFKGVVDAGMVTKGKPEPEVYLKSAAMIERSASDCIVFEDAISGLKAGQSAGAKTVALATSHKREELFGDMIIDDFTQIDLDQILNLFKK
ncbi:MAG: HAD superfamily hydrolase (TIGR01509 family) [Marinoscillum sp.]|jgi:HAD superfamily hydrolase (TIGR01509 family)